MLTQADKWLIGILLLVAVAGVGLGLWSQTKADLYYVEISVDGRLVKSVELRDGYREEIRLGGTEHFNLIEIEERRVHMLDADCHDQICKQAGWISQPPQQIVCLPHRVVVKVVSHSQPDVDDIAR